MPRALANGIELEYESMGDGPPIVLIMGIGAQLISWHDGFCRMLADEGFRVIRFDNRDTGLSTKLHEARVKNARKMIVRGLLGLPIQAPYTLVDMADDVAGLLDALELQSAHIVGASLGGMIAQTMAIVHPHRLRTLTSIMSNTGERRDIVGKPSALLALLGKPPKSRAEAVAAHQKFVTVCGSTSYPIDRELGASLAARAYDRCFYPLGFLRQMAAMIASGSRTQALGFVRTKTLVIHGTADPLVRPAGGHRTAAAIPGARLRLIAGMGHDLQPAVWPILVDEIAGHARLVEARRARGKVRVVRSA